MEQCSYQCIHRTFYAVMIGVSPILICLVCIGIARLILSRLEIVYYRRQKSLDRHSSITRSKTGRLALSYTPVSNAELQRIIRGEYQVRETNDSLTNTTNTNTTNTNSNTRRTPRFIKSILPRREPVLPSSTILANLVIRRDAIDASPLTGMLTPMETPLQPTFSIINEQEKRRPSVITITRESVETMTLAAKPSHTTPATPTSTTNGNFLTTNDAVESEQISNDALMTATKTLTTTTTVVVEEFLEFHSVSSSPCTLALSGITLSENNDDDDIINSEIKNYNNEQ